MVLLATGYDYRLPFLDPALIDLEAGSSGSLPECVLPGARQPLRPGLHRIRRCRLPAVRRDGPVGGDGHQGPGNRRPSAGTARAETDRSPGSSRRGRLRRQPPARQLRRQPHLSGVSGGAAGPVRLAGPGRDQLLADGRTGSNQSTPTRPDHRDSPRLHISTTKEGRRDTTTNDQDRTARLHHRRRTGRVWPPPGRCGPAGWTTTSSSGTPTSAGSGTSTPPAARCTRRRTSSPAGPCPGSAVSR